MRNSDMLDTLNIISFVMSLLNYGENLTQTDKQDLMSEVDQQTELVLQKLTQEIRTQNEILDSQTKLLTKLTERLNYLCKRLNI